MSDPIDRMQKSWSDMMTISRLKTEITRLNDEVSTAKADLAREITAREKAEQREKDARRVAIEEAAKVAILTANHLAILPLSVRKFPEVGGIIAARILELRSPVEEKIDEVAG